MPFQPESTLPDFASLKATFIGARDQIKNYLLFQTIINFLDSTGKLQRTLNAKIEGNEVAIAASRSYSVVTITAAYTATAEDDVILCNALGGVFTVTLPLISLAPRHIFHIKKIDSSGNVVTIDGNGTENIDGDLTVKLEIEDESFMIVNDGSNWFVI